jgi:hypothetical protein
LAFNAFCDEMKVLVKNTERRINEVTEEKVPFIFTENKEFPMITVEFLESNAMSKRKDFIMHILLKVCRSDELTNKTVISGTRPGRKSTKELTTLNERTTDFILGKKTTPYNPSLTPSLTPYIID